MSAAFSDWRRDPYAHNTGAVWQEEVGLLEAVSSEEMLWKPRALKKMQYVHLMGSVLPSGMFPDIWLTVGYIREG